ncbi:AAA family ATPase [Devosia sp. CAU 1758]
MKFSLAGARMFILLNGSFGIGKTTTARLIARQIPGTAISDPEHVGFVLRRLPPWTLGLRQQPGDYQDMALWRRLIVHQARLVHLRARTVIVPMTFTNLDYLDTFAGALRTTAPVKRLCLVAPLEVIQSRLLQRAEEEGREGLTDFERRRSTECAALLGKNPAYGIPIDAGMTSDEIVQHIERLLSGPNE